MVELAAGTIASSHQITHWSENRVSQASCRVVRTKASSTARNMGLFAAERKIQQWWC